MPLLIRWPGRVPAALVSEQHTINMDLSATIVGAAGTAESRELDGIDLLPILEGKAPPEARTFFWRTDYPAYKQRAVRRGRFKYLLDDTTEFLFDLETDIGERTNLAYRHPDVVKELQSALAAWETELAR